MSEEKTREKRICKAALFHSSFRLAAKGQKPVPTREINQEMVSTTGHFVFADRRCRTSTTQEYCATISGAAGGTSRRVQERQGQSREASAPCGVRRGTLPTHHHGAAVGRRGATNLQGLVMNRAREHTSRIRTAREHHLAGKSGFNRWDATRDSIEREADSIHYLEGLDRA